MRGEGIHSDEMTIESALAVPVRVCPQTHNPRQDHNPMTEQNTADSYTFTEGFETGPVIVDDAYFGYDEKYMQGETPIFILELDPVDGGGETRRQFFSFGDGWTVSDDGQSIVHKSGDPTKRLNGNSSLAKLVSSAAQLPGVAKIFQSRGPATSAAIWKGLCFDFLTTEKDSSFKGETRKQRTTVASAFYANLSRGLDGASGAGTPTAPAVAEVGSWGIPTSVESDLTALAQSASSHGEFHERAKAEVAGVEGDPAAEGLVADPAFYETLKAGA